MKFLVLFSCALAVASAGILAPVAYAGHGIHLPTIDASGVPVDTAEVQHARAAHATHHAVAAARAGPYEYAPYVAHAYAAPLVQAYAAPYVHGPVVAHHYRKRRGVVAAYAAPFAYAAYGAQHLPTIDASGVPVDTAEVQHAKAAHATHHAVAATRAGPYEYSPYVAHAYAAPVVAAAHPVLAHGQAYPTTAVLPAVSADGIPLDTPEVAHAKADHFAAYNAEAARNSVHLPYVAHAYAAPYAYAAPWVPADTPEVAQAKAEHFAAHAAAAH